MAMGLIGVVVGTMVFVVQNVTAERNQAFKTLQTQTQEQADVRARTTRRIDILQDRIDQLVATVREQQTDIGERGAIIQLLEKQVRELGGKPITKG